MEAKGYDRWLSQHSSHEGARRAHGITDGPFYRDRDNPQAALVHRNVEGVDRAMKSLRSEAFRDAARLAVNVRLEVWSSQIPG
ncbi:MAG TPA: hypothetical protein VJJ46_01740 [Anaerolineales bacterium]|nr:hypothetical protein [Anaerolineales bacterium]